MGFGGILSILALAFTAKAASVASVPVLIWDEYFRSAELERHAGLKPGQLGSEFSWSGRTPDEVKSLHGLQAAYLVVKDQAFVKIFSAHGPALPWQDPEICALTADRELNDELRRLGYDEIPDCRAKAHEAILRLTEFLRSNGIRIVNMSHGTYFERYVSRNPDLLAAKYPKVDSDVIQRFLYRNFLAIGEVAGELFELNPNVLFVAAAGNYSDDVDRDLPMKWSEENPRWYYVPTMYASLTDKYANLIAVASTSDGEKLSPGSNYGKSKVAFAVKVGDIKVPGSGSEWTTLGGTSEAAALTTRILSKYIVEVGRPVSALELKDHALKAVEPRPSMANTLISGGILNKMNPTRFVPVVEKVGRFREFLIPDEVNPKNYGCHSLTIDSRGVLWMTMPWSNNFLSFDPKTETFKAYPLPTPESRPDGITIDQNDNVWAGVYPKGGFVRLNTKTGVITEFPHPEEKPLNITHMDSKGRVWATGHRAQTLSMWDPALNRFTDWRVRMDWPLDIRVDENDDVWATALKGFQMPWGPGALVRARAGSEGLEYFPLPEREERLQAYWLAPAGDQILVTLLAAGAALFNKTTHAMDVFERADRLQVYNITRTSPSGQVVMTNSHEKFKSLDFIDPKNPNTIQSYRLPNQTGEPREAIVFDREQNLWYCQTFTNILGKLESGG